MILYYLIFILKDVPIPQTFVELTIILLNAGILTLLLLNSYRITKLEQLEKQISNEIKILKLDINQVIYFLLKHTNFKYTDKWKK